MLVYNTTYHVDDEMIGNFLIWLKECYIPEVEKHGLLKTPRLCKVLNHREDTGVSYSLQWVAESPTDSLMIPSIMPRRSS